MNFDTLIGLEVADAEDYLRNHGVNDFKFVYYTDRKQQKYDKELVTAVRQKENCLEIVVCRYLLCISEQ